MQDTEQLMTIAQGNAINDTLKKILHVLEGVGMEGKPGMIQIQMKIVKDLYNEPNGILRRVSKIEDNKQKWNWTFLGYVSAASTMGAGIVVILKLIFKV